MRELHDRPVGGFGGLHHARAHLVNRPAGLFGNAGAGAELDSRSLQLSSHLGQLLRDGRQRISRRRYACLHKLLAKILGDRPRDSLWADPLREIGGQLGQPAGELLQVRVPRLLAGIRRRHPEASASCDWLPES